MTCLYICLSVIHVFAQTREHGRTGEFNILDFGATRDTMMVHTKAINEAIESCYRQGGGRVVIPPGKFKTGTIFLKDNVELAFMPVRIMLIFLFSREQLTAL